MHLNKVRLERTVLLPYCTYSIYARLAHFTLWYKEKCTFLPSREPPHLTRIRQQKSLCITCIEQMLYRWIEQAVGGANRWLHTDPLALLDYSSVSPHTGSFRTLCRELGVILFVLHPLAFVFTWLQVCSVCRTTCCSEDSPVVFRQQ